MELLVDMRRRSLWRGDVLRLAKDYDHPEGRGTVDLMFFIPLTGEDTGLGLITISGYKAGNVFCVFPSESKSAKRIDIRASWLVRNWKRWFCLSYLDKRGRPIPLPIDGTLVIPWDERELTVRTHAHSRPA